jgi:hypothetical protein
MSGKGDWRRPQQIDEDDFDDRWSGVFHRDKQNNLKMKQKKKMRGEPKRIGDDSEDS